ncbi:MAG: type II secretion system protein GspM [Anaerotignum sp.]
MSKSFTKREQMLLTILICILFFALYYFVIARPFLERIDAAQNQITTLNDEIVVEMEKLKKIKVMREEIEEASGYQTIIPDYDNFENVIQQMDIFLNGSMEYDLAFAETSEENGLFYRPIDVTFSCRNYVDARKIIDNIYDSPYKSVIDSVSVDNIEYNHENIVKYSVAVTMTVIFVEKKTQ